MRLAIGLPLAALGIAIGSDLAIPDSPTARPCTEIAEYLSDFSKRNPDLASDSGRAEFLKAAINLSSERGEFKGLAVEALRPRHFDSTLQAVRSLGVPIAEPNFEHRLQVGDLGGGLVDLYDARDFGGLVAFNHVGGTMHCSYGFLMESAQDGLRLGPILENEGGQICWDSTFEVFKVGARTFPAVATRDTYFSSMIYRIALLPTDLGPMNVNNPLCTVSVSYQPKYYVAEWFVDPDMTSEVSQQLKSKLEPILTDLASGRYVSAHGDEATISEEFFRDYNRHGSSISGVVPFAAEHNNAYSQLAGAYSPIKLNGKDYVLGYGDALYGWRTWNDSAFGLWAKNGTDLIPVAGGFMGKRGTDPKISVEGN